MRSIVEPGVQQWSCERSRRQARWHRSDPEGGVVASFKSRPGQERMRRAQQLVPEYLQPEHHCSTRRDQVLLVGGVRPCAVGESRIGATRHNGWNCKLFCFQMRLHNQGHPGI